MNEPFYIEIRHIAPRKGKYFEILETNPLVLGVFKTLEEIELKYNNLGYSIQEIDPPAERTQGSLYRFRVSNQRKPNIVIFQERD